jgi:uncharacterized membrane protein
MDISSFENSLYNTLNDSLFDFGFYHPYVVDFAIVLPIIALFLHFVSILTQADENSSKVYYRVSNMLFFIGAFFMVFAYITGIAEGNEIREALSVEGRGVYDAHKTLGTYIVIAFIFLSILKIISLLVKKDPIRYIFGTLITITLLILIYSYVLGISLVFDYGAGVACAS